MNVTIPRALYQFGDRVTCKIDAQECPDFDATITGINYDHRSDTSPIYTVTEDDGAQSDDWPESMLTPEIGRAIHDLGEVTPEA